MQYRPNEHWGTGLWQFIHTTSIIDINNSNCHIEAINKCIEELRNLVNVIPCNSCKETLVDYLGLLNENVYEKLGLFKWSVDLHNEVNRKLGKKIYAYPEAIERWCRIID